MQSQQPVCPKKATFNGAEGVSNVLEFAKHVFTTPGARKPKHFIYDTACDVRQQVLANKDEFWLLVGMCVDIYHLQNKHKKTHTFCQTHCNLADYPELKSEDGSGWWFNTSIAEQFLPQ
ncbi:hypothetical protein CONPUDRAFT_151195 [Coniophora puteana RWD-64-598 SS2]|uniref:Uncharacterized protein n=1 Tax=Coniophora puteana (strain RWD-64-598) TaxID=741705 RepID=A0A5M3MZU3_CONPW|nr:uncharacterized protein CONPUDRAFT_151195 [Coniophora puteana RWD-64-598 SS2]EIW84151.1 hypothetical protein CONPUDRAFT_151195 [Coniophora puteana RWD-64-598 SS2]